MLTSNSIEEALRAVGDLLTAEAARVGIVVMGGATLNMLGFVTRTTSDVDVIASIDPEEGDEVVPGYGYLVPPEALPDVLRRAAARVGRDFGLPPDWLNTEIAAQWKQGLPPWITTDLNWRQFGGLAVGLVGQRTLVALKLFAAVDQGPRSVHYQDLVALRLSPEELAPAAAWVATQDTSELFITMLDDVIRHVRNDTGHGSGRARPGE